MITAPGCWRPLKGLLAVIGMDFYQFVGPEVRNGTGMPALVLSLQRP